MAISNIRKIATYYYIISQLQHEKGRNWCAAQ